MIKLIKILATLLMIVVFYVALVKVYPNIGTSIDELTGTNFNKNVLLKSDDVLNGVSGIKGDTDSLIDGVGSNTKNRSRELQRDLDGMDGR
ncbi:MAG: hypothetical protein Q8K30_04675 [Candidatus Gracilibacteria bacterium]|nr:hypothetical protein [Candidatus Gracilibacteria bacterium]